MRTLAQYKSGVTTLRSVLKTCQTSNRREYVLALRFAQRRIRQIEKRVLI